MRFQLRRIDAAARPPDHIGYRHFVPARIGTADHGALPDVGMFQQYTLDLCRVDVFAAGNDQVLLAVVHEEIAVDIAQADIASAIPTVVQGFPRRSLVAPIFAEYVGAAHRDLAWRVRRQLAAGVVDDSGLAAQAGKSGRTDAGKIATEPGIDRDRTGLGGTVNLQH